MIALKVLLALAAVAHASGAAVAGHAKVGNHQGQLQGPTIPLEDRSLSCDAFAANCTRFCASVKFSTKYNCTLVSSNKFFQCKCSIYGAAATTTATTKSTTSTTKSTTKSTTTTATTTTKSNPTTPTTTTKSTTSTTTSATTTTKSTTTTTTSATITTQSTTTTTTTSSTTTSTTTSTISTDIAEKTEPYYNSNIMNYGHICASDSFDQKSADVACKEVGFSGGAKSWRIQDSPGDSIFAYGDLQCDGSEVELVMCKHVDSPACDSNKMIVLYCIWEYLL